MRKKKIQAIATGFTQGMQSAQGFEKSAALVCWPLAGYLRFLGVTCTCVKGWVGDEPHVWIEIVGKRGMFICDPTAGQFSTPQRVLPAVYVGGQPDWYSLTGKARDGLDVAREEVDKT